MTIIRDADTLQACVGKLPGPRDMKVIDFLDTHAQRWIASAPFALFAFASTAATYGPRASSMPRPASSSNFPNPPKP